MKKMLLVALAVIFAASLASAQGTGSVSGVVYDTLGNPVDGASIRLMTGGGGHHHHHMGENYYALSGEDGSFAILNVAEGSYTAIASKMMVGHDVDTIEVVAGQNTVVNFVLNGCHDGGGMHGDSLQIIEISGWAIVVFDSMRTQYFLDNNGDDQADYRLLFGPDWYDPGSGAERPADGDSIWITGGVMGYSLPQSVVVYEINGLFWREPGGHGGYGGGGDCPYPDSLELIEARGLAIVEEMHGMNMYFLDTNYDNSSEYMLNFGAPWYDPGNGAQRPDNGDTVEVVGGLMDGCMMGDVIIVYEINGLFWRQPGDTIALWVQDPTGISEPETRALPNDYVVASSYPNPFNPTAVIAFELQQPENVKVTVYDLLGRRVATLADGVYPAGRSEVLFDAGDIGSGSATYFYRVEAGSQSITGKMTLLK